MLSFCWDSTGILLGFCSDAWFCQLYSQSVSQPAICSNTFLRLTFKKQWQIHVFRGFLLWIGLMGLAGWVAGLARPQNSRIRKNKFCVTLYTALWWERRKPNVLGVFCFEPSWLVWLNGLAGLAKTIKSEHGCPLHFMKYETAFGEYNDLVGRG